MAEGGEIPKKEVTEMNNGFQKKQSKPIHQRNMTSDWVQTPVNTYSASYSSTPSVLPKDTRQQKSSASNPKLFDDSDRKYDLSDSFKHKLHLESNKPTKSEFAKPEPPTSRTKVLANSQKLKTVLESGKYKPPADSTRPSTLGSDQRGSSTSNLKKVGDSEQKNILLESQRNSQLQSKRPTTSDLVKQKASSSCPKVSGNSHKSEMVLDYIKYNPTLESTRPRTLGSDQQESSNEKNINDRKKMNLLFDSLKRQVKLESDKAETTRFAQQVRSSTELFDEPDEATLEVKPLIQNTRAKSVKQKYEWPQQQPSNSDINVFDNYDKSKLLLDSLTGKPSSVSKSQIFDESDKAKFLLESLERKTRPESTKATIYELTEDESAKATSNAKSCDDLVKCLGKPSDHKTSTKSSKLIKPDLEQQQSSMSNSKTVDKSDKAKVLPQSSKQKSARESSKQTSSHSRQREQVSESTKRKQKSRLDKLASNRSLEDFISAMEAEGGTYARVPTEDDPRQISSEEDDDLEDFLDELIDYVKAFDKKSSIDEPEEMTAEEMLRISAERLTIMSENFDKVENRMDINMKDLEGMRASLQDAMKWVPGQDPKALDTLLDAMNQVVNMQMQLTEHMTRMADLKEEAQVESEHHKLLSEHHRATMEKWRKADEMFDVYREQEKKLFECLAEADKETPTNTPPNVPFEFMESELQKFKDKMEQEIKKADISHWGGAAKAAMARGAGDFEE